DGLLAVGGDLRPERLLLAYRSGIFPWYSEGQPILWHSPDPRMVLVTRDLEVPRSLRKTIRRQRYRLTFDAVFGMVVAASASRAGASGSSTARSTPTTWPASARWSGRGSDTLPPSRRRWPARRGRASGSSRNSRAISQRTQRKRRTQGGGSRSHPRPTLRTDD